MVVDNNLSMEKLIVNKNRYLGEGKEYWCEDFPDTSIPALKLYMGQKVKFVCEIIAQSTSPNWKVCFFVFCFLFFVFCFFLFCFVFLFFVFFFVFCFLFFIFYFLFFIFYFLFFIFCFLFFIFYFLFFIFYFLFVFCFFFN